MFLWKYVIQNCWSILDVISHMPMPKQLVAIITIRQQKIPSASHLLPLNIIWSFFWIKAPKQNMPACFQATNIRSLNSSIFIQFSHSAVSDSATAWIAACKTSLSFTISQSLLKFMSIELSNHFIFCLPLLFFPSIFPSIRVFSNESVLHISWPKY